ncbi:DMT family transporter [bacterium]|nr:MAG: DMT family transporter [bacterium]
MSVLRIAERGVDPEVHGRAQDSRRRSAALRRDRRRLRRGRPPLHVSSRRAVPSGVDGYALRAVRVVRRAARRPGDRCGVHEVGSRSLIVLLPCALWGGTWVAVKVAEGAGMGPFAFAAARALPAGIVLALLTALSGRWQRPPREDRAALVAMMLTTALFFGLTFLGAERLSGGLSSLLANASPLFAVVLAAVLEHERVHRNAVAGVLLGALGVGVIAIPALREAPGDLLAMGIMLVGALALAFNVIAMKRASHLDPLLANAAQMTGAGIVLTVAALAFGELRAVHLDGATLWAIAYVSLVATALAYVVWSRALTVLSVARASVLLFLVPVFGHVWSWVFLHEPVVPVEVLGAAIAVAGIALAAGGTAAPALEPE